MGKVKSPVIHFEIGCDNLSETIDFYKKTFEWEISSNENSAIIENKGTNGIPGHITELGHEPRNYINIYIESENINQDLKKIETNGGEKLIGPIMLPDNREFAWFRDVAGNTVGLITSE